MTHYRLIGMQDALHIALESHCFYFDNFVAPAGIRKVKK